MLRHTRLGDGAQIPRYPLELGGWELDGGAVLGLWDTQVLLINVHQLDVVLADAICRGTLEDEVHHVRAVLSLKGEHIGALCGAEDFGERVEVDAERNVAVAAVWLELLRSQHHGHERDVRIVHGLERDARVIAVEVAVLYQVLDRIDRLELVRSCSICEI